MVNSGSAIEPLSFFRFVLRGAPPSLGKDRNGNARGVTRAAPNAPRA